MFCKHYYIILEDQQNDVIKKMHWLFPKYTTSTTVDTILCNSIIFSREMQLMGKIPSHLISNTKGLV